MKSVCVYCGSSPGADPAFIQAAQRIGRILAATSRKLVYGGGRVGLMGIVADACLEAGGRVVGVIPQALVDREVAHEGLTDLIVVRTMHERKARMAELAEGFIALPGGLGTLEELFEIWTWSQLGINVKPLGLLNVAGFFDPLLHFLDHMREQRFVRPEHRDMLKISDDPEKLFEAMTSFRQQSIPKWLDA